jgi:hypothetical protein
METNTALAAEEGCPMKFILNGRTFDTASSSVVAVSRGSDYASSDTQYDPEYQSGAQSRRWEMTLYRTAKGAFFVHDHTTVKFARGKPVVQDEAMELADGEAALNWIEQFGATVIDSTGLELPPEA